MNSKVSGGSDNIITREPLPASQKVYVSSSDYSDVRVPMRAISLTDGSSVTVYDTSGPYTDPSIDINVHEGLAEMRSVLIEARSDTEQYDGREIKPIDNGHEDSEKAFQFYNPKLQRRPRRAQAGKKCDTTALRT